MEFRVDKTGIIHAPVGKLSFGTDKLQDNAEALIGAVLKAKPSAAKGKYVRGVSLSSTMGPGIQVDETAMIERSRRSRREDHAFDPQRQRTDPGRLRGRPRQGAARLPARLPGDHRPAGDRAAQPGARRAAASTWWSRTRSPCAPSTARPWPSSRSTSWGRRRSSSASPTRSRVAKALTDYAKDVPAIKLKAGLVEGRAIAADQIKDIASLPSREELIAKLLFLMQSPVTRLRPRAGRGPAVVRDGSGPGPDQEGRNETRRRGQARSGQHARPRHRLPLLNSGIRVTR